jgi:transcriptional regulator with XRE-family HTH domain
MVEGVASLASHLADNLRAVRQKRGLTQQQLARLCEIPRSTVANIETGAGNPTLAVLAQLARPLQLSIEELLSPPRGQCRIFEKSSLPSIVRGRDAKATLTKLLPHATPGFEIDRFELMPKARFAGAPHRPGTQEYLFCERGRIELWVSGDRFEVSTGDVAAFPADQAHSYHNQGTRTAVGFSVVAIGMGRED